MTSPRFRGPSPQNGPGSIGRASGYPTPTPGFSQASQALSQRFKRGSSGGARLPRDKIAVIHVAKHQLGMDDGAYRDLLQSAAGVRSSVDLDEEGFRQVMRRFERLGFHSAHAMPPDEPERRADMASPAQLHYIRSMWAKWLGRDDRRALGRWLDKRYGVSDLRFANSHVAGMAILGLKAMLARQAGETRHGADGRTNEGGK